ncbi:hypothetical protein U9M48_037007 [Paspalum notatum var. saurae]|uniref:Pseudouridine synthase RsuA/RluA-like domain-containing protein n=1 Tax=Paspalum notatum var. saurae TaxID=547442 RepID=A0AAQ3X9I0_PASNO
MTKLPLPLPLLHLQHPAGAAASPLRFLLPPARHVPAMSAATTAAPSSGEYPSPVSPPYPAASKDVELRRAMTASARSAAFALRGRRVRGRVARRRRQASRRLLRRPPHLPPLLRRLRLSPKSRWKYGTIYVCLVVSTFRTIVGLFVFCQKVNDQYFKNATTKPNLHLANRLDRDTSGLMVITKCNKVAGKLVKAFTDHKVKKTYLALCIGCPPTWEKIKICSGHGRSKHGAWRVYAMSDVGRSLPGGSVVRDMSTQFEVLGVNGKGQFREPYSFCTDDIQSITVQEKAAEQSCIDDVKNSVVLVRAYPQSGRTHQIRLHCQYLGFPIRGDAKYGGVIEWNGLECEGHALHAESLSFVHPITGLPVTFQSPLPPWAKDIISTMK